MRSVIESRCFVYYDEKFVYTEDTSTICIYSPCWHVGQVRIYSSYKAFTTEKMDAILGVRMGLQHVNVTLTSTTAATGYVRSEALPGLEYNERFEFLNGEYRKNFLCRNAH
ncbi:hypothetical protein AB6A40_010897 [Gnathostoma spinigerum]|uniref:Uncharacterized protein n=1 Tax=Gnathostoma spinigerum TaxID=75299 RepID=A0ABD6EW64_9BILA